MKKIIITILGILGLGCATVLGGQIINSGTLTIPSITNSYLATDGSGNIIATTTPTMSESDPIFMAASTSLGYLTTSTGLTVANFASANISQWTNDAGYVTSSSGGPETDPIWTAASTTYLTTTTAASTYGALAANNSWTGTQGFASGTFTQVTTTALSVGSDRITDITGTNLEISSASLRVNPILSSITSIATSDGTLATPSYRFSSDSDNGMYRVGTNNIGLVAGGNKVVDINSTGVGINSAPSSNSLYVKGSSTNSIISAYTSSSQPAMVILAGGSVGYGTASPSGQVEYVGNGTQVDVYWSNPGANTSTLRLVGASGANYFQSATNTAVSGSAADIFFTSMFAGNTWMKIASDGQVLMPAVYDDTVGATNRDLYIDNTGKLGYVVSSQKYKENIENVSANDVSFIDALKVKKYDYKNKSMGEDQMGLIAEEVAQVCPKCVSYKQIPIKEMRPSPTDPDKMVETIVGYQQTNEPETVNYSSPYVIASLIEKIQIQQAQINELAERVEAIDGKKMTLGSVEVKDKNWFEKLINWIINLI